MFSIEDLVLADATRERSELIAEQADASFLLIDDLAMRKLPVSAAKDSLEIVMRRYERASTLITSNRPLEYWPRMFGHAPAVITFLDRLMHHSHLIQFRGKSYRFHEPSTSARVRKGGQPK